MIKKTQVEDWHTRASRVLPGGVNSPVRAFGAVGGAPVFISEARGAYLYDTKKKRYVDLISSWGAIILGHGEEILKEALAKAIEKGTSYGISSPAEVEMAELISTLIPSMEQVRMVNSGTEATMSALRLARAYTGKNKLIKFRGNYHGHADPFLIAGGSALTNIPNSFSSGVPTSAIQDTLLSDYNDLEQVRNLLEEHKDKVACIIVEPIAGNMGCVLPKPGFLKGLRELSRKAGVLLIFDEVITGFRLHAGGVQDLFGVSPDISTLGKIIGAGFPVGAYGGKKEIMKKVSPLGDTYQAGTLSGNPLAMIAGKTVLNHLHKHPEIYTRLKEKTKHLSQNLKGGYTCNSIGSMYTYFFTKEPVENQSDAQKSDTQKFARYFHHMLSSGIYLPPSPYESNFLSHALKSEDIEFIVEKHNKFIQETG
ncbi:MAG: glutamate-1-semialdehyde 2,1-aminomutase [Cytophagales bacterium]|nr:glutamate-1-semialdehyde 2,1-aminomutase [Cytophagales bacterium]